MRARAPHPLVGPPSLHAAVLQGGTELSTYAARCTLKIERRAVPGEGLAQVEAEIQAILERLSAADGTFRAGLRTLLERMPFACPPDAPLVRAIQESVIAHRGKPAACVGAAHWMDTAILAGAGVEAAAIGPTGAGAHTAEEWVDLRSVEDTAAILALTAASYCQEEPAPRRFRAGFVIIFHRDFPIRRGRPIRGPLPRHPECTMDAWAYRSPSGLISTASVVFPPSEAPPGSVYSPAIGSNPWSPRCFPA